MSRPTPPALTVRYEGSTRTFAAGNDVVVGRDLRADVRIGNPLISRAHVVLRFDQGRWLAIDNGSLNGMYVNGRRIFSMLVARLPSDVRGAAVGPICVTDSRPGEEIDCAIGAGRTGCEVLGGYVGGPLGYPWAGPDG